VTGGFLSPKSHDRFRASYVQRTQPSSDLSRRQIYAADTASTNYQCYVRTSVSETMRIDNYYAMLPFQFSDAIQICPV